MNSSGIKRGLATTAIAALAITGVPAIANAAPLVPAGTAVDLRTAVDGTIASVANDGTNSTYSLVATAGTDATVENVSFFFTPTGGTARLIGVAQRADSGEFQLEWTPRVGDGAGTVSAQVSDSVGGNLTGTADTATITVSSTTDSVEIASGNELGYFVQPGDGSAPVLTPEAYGARTDYVAGLRGTTSKATGSVNILAPGAGSSVGVNAATGTVSPVTGSTTGTWIASATLVKAQVTPNDATDVDQVLPVVAADGTAGASRDAEGYNAYSQTISDITATTSSFNAGTGTGTVTVTVTDQRGNPIAGVNIGRSGDNANPNVGITDANGEVEVDTVAPGTYTYYADASNAAGFTNGVDRQTSVTVGAQRATQATFESRDGNAFDLTEFSTGDLRVRVLDANNNPVVGETFFYTYTFDAFEDGVRTATTRQFTTTTDAQGYANLELATAGDYTGTPAITADDIANGGTYTVNGFVNRDGSAPGQDPVDLAVTGSFKAGQSDVVFDGPDATDRQIGTTQVFTGSVELADGTGLVGRTLNVTLGANGAAGDSALSTTQPAGTTRLSATVARVVTQSNGDFSVSVTDPAPASGTAGTPESDTLTARGTATNGSGTSQVNGIGTDEVDTVTINWVADAAATGVVLDSTFGGDGYAELIDVQGRDANGTGGIATPGRPVAFQVNLRNAAGNPLAGQTVTLTTSNGFFVDYNDTNADGNANVVDPDDIVLETDPAPAQGGQVGEFASLTNTITVTTDAQGNAVVVVGIERDAGFDDDGIVNASITATSSGVTNSSPIAVQFRTTRGFEALNPGSVEVVPETDAANVGDEVDVDVFAKDQFGNLVEDTVVLSDDTNDAGFEGQVGNGTVSVFSQFTSSNSAAQAVAEDETEQTITATWTQPSTTYTDTAPATPGFQAGVTQNALNSVTDTADIAWSEVNFGDFDITLTSSPEGDVKVNSAVTETVTVVDADGNPVAGVQVDFTRQGPGNQAGEDARVTNAQGQASYTFSSATVGTATVIAVVSDGQAGGQSETLTDTVNFVQAKETIRLNLSANNNGAKADRLKATTGKAIAEGAVVKFFRVKANGGSVQVGQAVLGADGSVKKNVKDINGKRFTKYFARVLPTDDTFGDRSNNTRVR